MAPVLFGLGNSCRAKILLRFWIDVSLFRMKQEIEKKLCCKKSPSTYENKLKG